LTQKREMTQSEEIVNAITHGVGVLLGTIGLIVLLVSARNSGNTWHIVSYSVYGTTLIFLYLASTLYHLMPRGRVKDIFKVIDHAAIFLLIAGCYTPITLIALRGRLGWTIFVIVWTIAIAGVVFKVFFIKKFKLLSTAMYVAMGWIIVFAIKPLIELLNTKSLMFLVAGGITYTLGAVVYSLKGIKYNHAIWHFFVLGGSTFHYFMMYYMLPN
jgi:hemolysin III